MTDKEIRIMREGEENQAPKTRLRKATEVTASALEEGGIDFVLPNDFDDNLKQQFFQQVENAKKNKASLMVAEGIKVIDRFAPAEPVQEAIREPEPSSQEEIKGPTGSNGPVGVAGVEETTTQQAEPNSEEQQTPAPVEQNVAQQPQQQWWQPPQGYYYNPAQHYNPHMPFQPAQPQQAPAPQEQGTTDGRTQEGQRTYAPNQMQPNTQAPVWYGQPQVPWGGPQYSGFIPPQPPQQPVQQSPKQKNSEQ